MTRRSAARVAWTLVGICAAGLATGLVLHSVARASDLGSTPPAIAFVTALLTFPIVGALIASRHPGHPIGWLLLAAGIANMALILFSGYGTVALEGERLPGGVVASWLSDVIWLPSVALSTTFLFLLFPDGELPGPRWRPVAWAAVIGTALVALALVFEPTLYGHPEIDGPLALPDDAKPVLNLIATVGFFLWAAATFGAVISLMLRFRRARADQRLQIKWVAFAAAISLVMVPSFTLEGAETLSFLEPLVLIAIPVSVGVAILRYRLYDIDRIINRTLVYAVLTALLIGVYVAASVGLGAFVRSVTGQENNALVIAASTLAVAALFGPTRLRIQGFIDRRFYRSKYDAARTVEAFTSRLREEIDLDSLNAELLGIVRTTMQPEHASLWLRNGGR